VSRLRAINAESCDKVLCLPNGTNVAAAAIFFKYVRTGGDWDFKGIMGEALRNLDGIEDHYFPIPGTNEKLNYDFWANLHFGYIGAAAGFTEQQLVAGADIFHIWSPTNHWGASKEATIRAGVRLRQEHPNPADLNDPNLILEVIKQNKDLFRQRTPGEPAYLVPGP
jgi:hypothetical protein